MKVCVMSLLHDALVKIVEYYCCGMVQMFSVVLKSKISVILFYTCLRSMSVLNN